MAKGNKVIVPTGKLAGAIERSFQRMEAGGPIKVVRHVIFPGPLQFHRYAGLPSDRRSLTNIIIHEPAPEAAADSRLMQRDLLLGNPKHAGNVL